MLVHAYASKRSSMFEGLQIEQVYSFKLLGLIINCHLEWKHYLNSFGIKITRVIGLFDKLKYTHYALNAFSMGTKCHPIE